MTTLAIIPARGGSKGVPLKNLRTIAGVSLVGRAVDAARRAARIDEVLVTTDHAGIAAEARAHGAGVVDRPEELAGDHCTSESALLHALDTFRARTGSDPDVTVFLQDTSPFIRPEDLDAAVARVEAGDADVVFSAVETYEFLWRLTDGPEGAVGINHDRATRPRRQDREPHYRETGAFYVMATAGFRAAGHRFFGRVGVQAVPESTAPEIDSLEDLALLRALAEAQQAPAADDATNDRVPGPDDWAGVEALVTDFDGVHTDDTASVDDAGHESVRVDRGDGLGLSALRRAGVPLLILSKERNPVVTARGRKLGVEVLQGVDDKAKALASWLDDHHLDAAHTVYVGNDVNDLPALAAVGMPVAVPDSDRRVLAAARTVLTRPGGHGALRELAEKILTAKGQTLV